MNKVKKLILFMVTFVVCLLPLFNWSHVNAAEDSLQKIKDKGTLVVGMSADFPPYEFTVKENGQTKFVGMDVDIIKQFAKDIGVKVEIKNMNFDSLLVALETNKIDCIISGMNPSPERKKSVDFSDIYYKSKQYLIINKADKNKYKTYKDLTGKAVGAQSGSIQYDIVKNNIDDVEIKGLTKLNDLVLALQSHKVDAVAMDEPTAKAYAANNGMVALDPKWKDVGDTDGTAIAFPKGSTSLVQAANKTIAKIKKDKLIDKKYLPSAGEYMNKNSANKTMWHYWTYFAKGIEYTLLITVLSVFFGFILGTLLALLRLSNSKFLRGIAIAYIEFVRGTPLMVQVMFIYFGVGTIIQSLPALLAGIIATSLNSGAYVAEVIRSGISSIDVGQTEAARSLGMSQKDTYRYVIIPQALKNIWPALGNEFITLIKESSIVSIIGVTDLMYQSQLVQSATYRGVVPLFITMMIYFVMTFGLSKLLGLLERKMKHD